MDYFVVRQSWDDREKLFEEIKQGRLRQGWSFNNRLSLDQAESTFIENYSRDADQSAVVSSRYAILRPLRFVKPGDIIVVPKQPVPSLVDFGLGRMIAGRAHSSRLGRE